MIKENFDGINQYIIDEETTKSLNTDNYVLGEGEIREIHKKFSDKRKNLEQSIKDLDLEDLVKLPSMDKAKKEAELKMLYLENKDMIDKAFGEVLKNCTKEQLLNYLSKKIKNKS